MPVYENLTNFAGKTVADWKLGKPIRLDLTYRLRLSYDDVEGGTEWTGKLAAFLQDPHAGQIDSLVVGAWGEVSGGDNSGPAVEALVAAAGRLPNLKTLFFGDITFEECEISWITQCDVSPLLAAYPNLEHLAIRGGQELSLGKPKHAKLKQLIIQAGGLPPEVFHEIAAAEFPELEHLELWLGEPNYGGDATVKDIAPLLTGELFPKLRYLGLKNSEIQDEIAAAAAQAPVIAKLDVLDLSMGTFSDDGAKALLNSAAVKRLKKLDIHHHYVSDELVAALKQLGIDVDAGDAQGKAPKDDRYIEIGE